MDATERLKSMLAKDIFEWINKDEFIKTFMMNKLATSIVHGSVYISTDEYKEIAHYINTRFREMDFNDSFVTLLKKDEE